MMKRQAHKHSNTVLLIKDRQWVGIVAGQQVFTKLLSHCGWFRLNSIYFLWEYK